MHIIILYPSKDYFVLFAQLLTEILGVTAVLVEFN